MLLCKMKGDFLFRLIDGDSIYGLYLRREVYFNVEMERICAGS